MISAPLSAIGSTWAYAAAGSLALAGLAILLIALLAGRARGRRRCPRCWYDMSGAGATFPLTCPECGRKVRTDGELGRTRRRWRLAIFGLVLAAPLIAQVSYLHGHGIYYALMPKWKRVETFRFGETTALRWKIRDPRAWGQRAEIRSRGRTILSIEDWDITFGQRDWSLPPDSSVHRLGRGDDLNGDGTPELVVFAYSGGAHCCYTVSILELSDPPILIATIDAQNGMAIKPVTGDATRRGQYDFDIPEQSFDYWNAPHVSSPMPSVDYRLLNHQLVIDLPAMLKPALEQNALDAEAARVRALLAAPNSQLEPDLWRMLLDLIYTGHEPAALRFFNQAWPPERPGKEAFLAEFRSVLDKSPAYGNFTAALDAWRHPRNTSPPLPDPPAAVLPAPSNRTGASR